MASTAVVTAIGCDAGGRGRALGVGVVDTESYDSWLGFLGRTLEGTLRRMSLMKEIQTGSGFRQCVSSRGLEQKEHRNLSSLSIGSAHAF